MRLRGGLHCDGAFWRAALLRPEPGLGAAASGTHSGFLGVHDQPSQPNCYCHCLMAARWVLPYLYTISGILARAGLWANLSES